MPAAAAHVDDELYARILKASKAAGLERVSPWVKSAIVEKLEGAPREMPGALDPDCLVRLAERAVPFAAADVRRRCEDAGLDQPKALAMILMAFADGTLPLSDRFMLSIQSKTAQRANGG